MDNNPKSYLKLKLLEIMDKFPEVNLTFTYYYDSKNLMHIILVSPTDFYDNNENYKHSEGYLTQMFDKLYDPQEVLFISDNSLIKLPTNEKEKIEVFSRT